MNRPIKFRVRMTRSESWFYWDIGDNIQPHDIREDADWETLGQFTGLLDRNGAKIYEGDIIHYNYKPGPGFWNDEANYKMAWKNTGFHASPASGESGFNGWLISMPGMYMPVCQELTEVIGDIYSNPELLEAA